jgi:hypothetical protein
MIRWFFNFKQDINAGGICLEQNLEMNRNGKSERKKIRNWKACMIPQIVFFLGIINA